MYPSSSSQKPMGQTGLTRYGSAPGSFLTNAVDSVIEADPNLFGHYFSADSSSLTSESTCKVSSSNDPQEPKSAAAPPPSHGSYPAPSSSSLLRQRSSPAGFLSHLTNENGSTFFFPLKAEMTVLSLLYLMNHYPLRSNLGILTFFSLISAFLCLNNSPALGVDPILH